MKYIFDFDDVLLFTTRHRKECIFPLVEQAGVSKEALEAYYAVARKERFSPHKLIQYFELPEALYEKIMAQLKDFLNLEVLALIQKLPKEDCFINSYGEEAYQKEKIERTEVDKFFSRVLIEPAVSKKETIENICLEFPNEQIFFIDDKSESFADLDTQKYPNLKTILYTGQDLADIIVDS